MSTKKKFLSLVLMLGVTALFILAVWLFRDSSLGAWHAGGYQNGQEYTQYDFAMGTAVSIKLYGNGDLEQLGNKLIADIKNLDTSIISWRDTNSELHRLNQTYIVGKEYPLSDILFTAVQETYVVCKDSEGALDFTIRPLAMAWNIENDSQDTFHLPAEETLLEARNKVGYEHVFINNVDSVCFEQEGMLLDLGASGKGYALDLVRASLENKNTSCNGAVVSVGGSILVFGSKNGTSSEKNSRKTDCWKVGVRNPKGDIDDMIGYLVFEPDQAMCISTSGDYEKYVEVDGVKYHHILNRETRMPAEAGLAQVTVVCENGLFSDALSTACFVLGYEKSLPLLEKYQAEAVFVDHENHIEVTKGLEGIFQDTK